MKKSNQDVSLSKVCLWAGLVVFAVFTSQAFPPGPTPQVPAGGGPPGAFPNTSVSSVNVVAKGNSSAFDGNVEITSFQGQGPIPWTITKYNRGDFAMRLAPANPADADTNTLGRGFTDFTAADNAALPENQSWRPHPALGIVMPTARQNGPINWNDGAGDFFPTVAISAASSGRGYDMVNGSFGTGQLDVNTGSAGAPPSGSPEANFSFSVTWFPYDAGWLGGNLGSPDASTGKSVWNGAGQHAAGLSAGLMKWLEFPVGSTVYGGLGQLRLPGVDALTGGMIFTTSSHGNSDVNTVGVAATNDTSGSYWVVTVREDSAVTGEEVATSGQYQFEFVYIPYNAQNLVGGYIEGATGNKLGSAGAFTLTRTAAGVYEFAVTGKGAADGTLLLQVADFEPGTSLPMASRAFMSYEFNQTSGKFVIQCRRMVSDTASELVDANFYVTWVDFKNPLSPPAGPRMRAQDAVALNDSQVLPVQLGNLAVNTHEREVLVTTVDIQNAAGYIDPILQTFASQAVIGYFYDPVTLTNKRGPFFIMGNPSGAIDRVDVKYNPVSRQYNVVGNARAYGGGFDMLMIALVNPDSVAGAGDPLAKVFIYDGLTNNAAYDDVSIAVSTNNGNFIVAAEHKIPGEGEGSVGALFKSDGTVLTPTASRLDLLQGAGDEDDPDVIYLPKRDVFMYLSNTDASAAGQLTNRVVGSIVQTTPTASGTLQVSGPEQPLAVNAGPAQGHPASLENPFNGRIITAFDTGGNDQPTGELSYYSLGAGPSYTFTQAQPQFPYLAGSGATPFRHQHPQLDADPNSGVILLGYQARNSAVGYPNAYVFNLLDKDGALMPSQLGTAYFLADSFGVIDTSVNYHNVKYSPISDSFLVVFTANDPVTGTANRTAYLAAVQITSEHLQPPSLTIELSGSNVIVRWPSSAAAYKLQTKARLTDADWTLVPGTPETEGSFLKMTLPATGSAFYRLGP